MNEGDKSPARRRRGKLTQKQKTELLSGGIEAFCQKYDYRGKAKSGIKLAHDRIRAALTALAGAEPPEPPVQPPEPYAGWVAAARELQLPEILKVALELLPPAGTVLSEGRKGAIKTILDFAIDRTLGNEASG